MPYSQEHKDKTRREIVRSARKLFNLNGFNGVSIERIMSDAGLSRGGFYNHFSSKEDLYAEAVTLILEEHPAENWDGVDIDMQAPDVARAVLSAYLSDQHFEDIPGSCPLIAIPNDVSRSGRVARDAFQTVMDTMLMIFRSGLDGDQATIDRRAMTLTAMCVGGMVLARTVADRELADDLREAVLGEAFRLAGWENGNMPNR